MNMITLMTDFGIRDGGVAEMKGVILTMAPQTNIVDLSHQIAPQNIQEAVVTLQRVAPYFPAGTIHVVVVDPGVGTRRRPIAARLGEHYFVGPDNGLITPLLERAERLGGPTEIVVLDQPGYWLPEVSDVFHGRDIFAPVGAHLANGVPINQLGDPIDNPIRFSLPAPLRESQGLRGEVLSIDDFGNIQTNIFRKHLAGMGEVKVRLGDTEILGLARTFGEQPAGSLIALIGTDHDLMVSVVNGDAARRLNAKIGDPVIVESLAQAGT